MRIDGLVANFTSRADPGLRLAVQPVDLENRMPRKVRDLISELELAGFVNRGGKGSHRNFVHPHLARPVVISGQSGDDAKHYRERTVKLAIEELNR